jgi:hypothetical protein
MTDPGLTDPAPIDAAAPQRRNRVGVVALVLALFAAAGPLVAWIVVAIIGAVESTDVDEAIYVGFLGGMIVFFGVVAVLSPVSLTAVVLGIVSLFRRGSKAPGIVAIIIGVVGSLGLFWLPVVLAEVVPGW